MRSRENQHQKTKDKMSITLVKQMNEKVEKMKSKNLPEMEELC